MSNYITDLQLLQAYVYLFTFGFKLPESNYICKCGAFTCCRTVARKSSIGGLYVCAGCFTFVQGEL